MKKKPAKQRRFYVYTTAGRMFPNMEEVASAIREDVIENGSFDAGSTTIAFEYTVKRKIATESEIRGWSWESDEDDATSAETFMAMCEKARAK